MNNVWLSAFFGDGKNPPVKHIICNSAGEPLLFDTQINALNFWGEYKSRFDVPLKFDRTIDRVSSQVVRNGDPDVVLFGMLDSEDREKIKPKPSWTIYSDTDCNPEWV